MDNHGLLARLAQLNITLLDARLSRLERLRTDVHKWQWQVGTLVVPDVRCPYCGTGVRSNAIWRLRRNTLLGQCRIIDKHKLIGYRPRHPHANSQGEMCLGNTGHVVVAFTMVNPGSSYWDDRVTIPWLQFYCGHNCARMKEIIQQHPPTGEENYGFDTINDTNGTD